MKKRWSRLKIFNISPQLKKRRRLIAPSSYLVVQPLVRFIEHLFQKHLHVTATYVQDEISDPEAPTLPEDVVMMPARVRLYEHDSPKADGTPRRVRVILPLFNMGDKPINLSGQTHKFNFRFEVGRES